MTRKGISDPVKAWGMCLITSDRYAQDHGLYLIRITGMTYPGREHWAAIDWDAESRDGVVVDLTARQFDPDAHVTWEGPLDAWLDDACEWLRDGLDYEVHSGVGSEIPVFADSWVREDVEAGEMPFSMIVSDSGSLVQVENEVTA